MKFHVSVSLYSANKREGGREKRKEKRERKKRKGREERKEERAYPPSSLGHLLSSSGVGCGLRHTQTHLAPLVADSMCVCSTAILLSGK